MVEKLMARRATVCIVSLFVCLVLTGNIHAVAMESGTTPQPPDHEMSTMAYTAHIAHNRFDEACQLAEQICKASPDDREWRMRAAQAAELAGKRERALSHLLYLVELGDGTARQEALRLTRAMNEFPVRRYLLEVLLLAGNDDPDLLKEYLDISQKLGAASEAYELLSALVNKINREQLLTEQARLAELLNRPGDAINALNKLALLRPLTPEEIAQRAKLQFGQGDLDRAWQDFYGMETAGSRQQLPAQRPEFPAPATDQSSDSSTEPRPILRWRDSMRKQQERRFFMIEPPTVGVLLKYELNQDERETAGQKAVDRTHTVTERLDLASKGFVYHPALMRYELSFSPEFRQNIQSRTEIAGNNQTESNQFNPNFKARATLLEQKPYSLTTFAQHLETQSWATYTGVTRTTSTSYGADLSLKYAALPTTAGFSRSSSEQSGYYGTDSNLQEFHLLSRHSGITGDSSLSSNYSNNRQTTNGTAREVTTINSIFSNQYPAKSLAAVKLTSNIQHMRQESGSTRNDSLSVNEQLVWKHRDNLMSDYQYSYRQVTTDSSGSYWNSASAKLTHKLYENLTSMIGITGTSNTVSGGGEQSLTGLVNADYQRTLSNWGKLNLSAGATQKQTQRTGTGNLVQITNEPHTLSSSTETFLNEIDVAIASVVVTNSSGTVIYTKDIDYQLDIINRSIRISRLILGAIPDGQLVLVSYSYTRSAAYNDRLLTQNYGINLELWRSLTLSYRYLQSSQQLLAGTPPDQLSNSTIQIATARAIIGWSESGFIYEDSENNSDLSYSRWEVSQGIALRYGSWFGYNLRAYYGETDYRSYDEYKQKTGATTKLHWSPSTGLLFELEGYLERVNGIRENTRNYGYRAGAEKSYRLWTARLAYKLSEQDDQLNDYRRRNHVVQFELSRMAW